MHQLGEALQEIELSFMCLHTDVSTAFSITENNPSGAQPVLQPSTQPLSKVTPVIDPEQSEQSELVANNKTINSQTLVKSQLQGKLWTPFKQYVVAGETEEQLNVPEPIAIKLSETRLKSNPLAREIILQRCGQNEPVSFATAYPEKTLKKCRKIGEGVYGEVFLQPQKGDSTVMKVIPIEGDLIVNGEKQKKYEEILSEIIISQELSNLRRGTENATSSYGELRKLRLVIGSYPPALIKQWDKWDEENTSQNDPPTNFPADQLYIVLEFANAGEDLEAYIFVNAQQAYSVFRQLTCSLAVAEKALQFEHRDLHWGNILIKSVERDKKISFNIDGYHLEVPSHGVEVSIIDFTMSRIICEGVCIYNDLSEDPDLFTGSGDYQFEIYRLMQTATSNSWNVYKPYTNVLWMHYTLDKLIVALRYKFPFTKLHRKYIELLKHEFRHCLEYESMEQYVQMKYLSHT